jgi:hypothetical protein
MLIVNEAARKRLKQYLADEKTDSAFRVYLAFG